MSEEGSVIIGVVHFNRHFLDLCPCFIHYGIADNLGRAISICQF